MESNRLNSFDLVASGFSSNIVGHFDYLNTDDNTSMEEGEELFFNKKISWEIVADQHGNVNGYFSGIRKLVNDILIRA